MTIEMHHPDHRESANNVAHILAGKPGWLDFIWIIGFVGLVALLQFIIPYPLDDDTAYHFSVAKLLRENGILQAFPWTRFSWQYDHYADKEFLFHLLFVPFTGLGFVNAARLVGTIAGAAIMASLYLLLRAERVRLAWLWTLLPLGSTLFIYRFAQVRPQLLSIALALVLLWAYAHGRLRIVGLVSLLYPLTYVAFWQIPLLLILAVEGGRLCSGERLRWQPIAMVLLGIAVGVILHPNSWNLLQMNWIHMVDVLFRNAWGAKVEFNMGEEFDPFTLGDWLKFLFVPTLMAGAALVLGWRERHRNFIPLGFALATLLFCLLTVRTNRFLEYFVPFAALSLAVASRERITKILAPILLAVSLLQGLVIGSVPFVNVATMPIRNWYMEPAVASKFNELIPSGAKVFTCGWEYTGSLMLNLPERYYMVALDPTLMYKRDAKLYDSWYRLLLDAPDNAAEVVRSRFASRYVVCQDYAPLHPFFRALASDPEVKVLFANPQWLLFDVGEQGKKVVK